MFDSNEYCAECHITIFHICTGDVCHFKTLPVNAALSSHSGVYGDVVISACNYGYSFLNHSTSESFECLELGVWSKVPEVCHRK